MMRRRVCCLMLLALIAAPCAAARAQSAAAHIGDIEKTVYGSGTVQPVSQPGVYARVSGTAGSRSSGWATRSRRDRSSCASRTRR